MEISHVSSFVYYYYHHQRITELRENTIQGEGEGL